MRCLLKAHCSSVCSSDVAADLCGCTLQWPDTAHPRWDHPSSSDLKLLFSGPADDSHDEMFHCQAHIKSILKTSFLTSSWHQFRILLLLLTDLEIFPFFFLVKLQHNILIVYGSCAAWSIMGLIEAFSSGKKNQFGEYLDFQTIPYPIVYSNLLIYFLQFPSFLLPCIHFPPANPSFASFHSFIVASFFYPLFICRIFPPCILSSFLSLFSPLPSVLPIYLLFFLFPRLPHLYLPPLFTSSSLYLYWSSLECLSCHSLKFSIFIHSLECKILGTL